MTTVSAAKCYIVNKAIQYVDSQSYGFDFEKEYLYEVFSFLFLKENNCSEQKLCIENKDFYEKCIAKKCITFTEKICNLSVVDITDPIINFDVCSNINIIEI